MLTLLGLLICFVLHPSSASSRRELLQQQVTMDAFCANLTAVETDLTNKFRTDSPDEIILSEFNCSCSAETDPVLALNCNIVFTPAEDASLQAKLTQEATFSISNTVYVLDTVATCTALGDQEIGCFTYEITGDDDCDTGGGNYLCASSCQTSLCASCEICNVTHVALQDCNGTLAILDLSTCENAASPLQLWDKDSFPIITLFSDDKNMTTTSGVTTGAGSYLSAVAMALLFALVAV